MSRRRRHYRKSQDRLTEAQAAALIPAGPVSKTYASHGGVDIETRGATEKGAAAITGEIVATPVRRLFLSHNIGLEHVAAAQRFEADHDAAYCSSANVLAKVQVDSVGGGGDCFMAMERKAMRGIAYARAEMALPPRLVRIARTLILADRDTGIEGSYTAIGELVLPNATARDQSQAGRGVGALVLQVLADVYGLTNPRAA